MLINRRNDHEGCISESTSHTKLMLRKSPSTFMTCFEATSVQHRIYTLPLSREMHTFTPACGAGEALGAGVCAAGAGNVSRAFVYRWSPHSPHAKPPMLCNIFP